MAGAYVRQSAGQFSRSEMPASALSTGAKNKTPYLSDAAATAADGPHFTTRECADVESLVHNPPGILISDPWTGWRSKKGRIEATASPSAVS